MTSPVWLVPGINVVSLTLRPLPPVSRCPCVKWCGSLFKCSLLCLRNLCLAFVFVAHHFNYLTELPVLNLNSLVLSSACYCLSHYVKYFTLLLLLNLYYLVLSPFILFFFHFYFFSLDYDFHCRNISIVFFLQIQKYNIFCNKEMRPIQAQ